MEDCMCSRVALYPLRYPIRFWLYMHPKVWAYLKHSLFFSLLWLLGRRCAFSVFFVCPDYMTFIKDWWRSLCIFWQDFLRQNNTGKLLWKVFGVEAATLCLFGIAEHEEIMWNAFNLAGLTAYVVFHVALSCQSIIIISIHLWLFHNCTKWLHVSLRK